MSTHNKYRISFSFNAETDEQALLIAEFINLVLVKSEPIKFNDEIGFVSIPKDGSVETSFVKLN